MTIRELRIRYEVPEMFSGRPIVHAVICEFPMLKVWTDKVKEARYKLVGIDERFREQEDRSTLDEGWHEISDEVYYQKLC